MNTGMRVSIDDKEPPRCNHHVPWRRLAFSLRAIAELIGVILFASILCADGCECRISIDDKATYNKSTNVENPPECKVAKKLCMSRFVYEAPQHTTAQTPRQQPFL